MAGMNEHFRQSGYVLHRQALRKECLPRCCRENLHEMAIGIKFMDRAGGDVVLPLVQCACCSGKYALSDGRYIAVKSLLRFDVVRL